MVGATLLRIGINNGLGTQFALMSRAFSRECSYVSNPQPPDVHHACAISFALHARPERDEQRRANIALGFGAKPSASICSRPAPCIKQTQTLQRQPRHFHPRRSMIRCRRHSPPWPSCL
jgi:hypothetical protein